MVGRLVAVCRLSITSILLLYLNLPCIGSAFAQSDDYRVALVIGNSSYTNAPSLPNAARDARDVGRVLGAMGYSIVEAYDASKAQIEAAIEQAGRHLAGRKGVGLVYYAGHAFQLGWKNFLVPVDAAPASGTEAARQSVDLQVVLHAFASAGNRVNVVVLDACRNNPYSVSADTRGLAPISAPPGTLIAYSTAPGHLAEDGDETQANGPYARYLIEELRKEGVRLEDALKRVRLQVRTLTNGRQVPWENTSLESDFYVDTRFVPPAAKATLAEVEVEFSEQIDAWRKVRTSRNAALIKDFLMRYPSGLISEMAQFQLDQIQAVAVRGESGRDGLTHLQSGTPRYAVGDVHVLNRQDLTGATRQIVNRVTRAGDDQVEFNDGNYIVDQMGSVLRNRYGTKEPGTIWVPADLFVGKRWRSAFTNTRPDGVKTFNYWYSRVTAVEDVTVPAGTFRTYRIERSGQARNPSGAIVDMTATTWVDPASMLAVRSTGLHRAGSRITDRYVDELVELRRAR